MLFKDNPWFNELQQQLMSNAALKRYFHIFILVYHPQHSYDFWTMLSHSRIWMNVGRLHPLRLTMGPFVLKLKCALHRMNMGDEHHWWCQCISFHNPIWQAERNPWRRTFSLQRWVFYCKLWDACLDDWMISKKADDNMYLKSTVQLEASSWLIDNFNGRWHAQPIKGQFWRESRRWMKWATSHMEAWSSLRSSKSSNHHGRPIIGTALTSKWKASTRMSQCIERIKKALNNKQRHPVMMEHWRGGDLYFKSGKDAYMSSNIEALHIFLICCRKNPQCSPTRLGTKKELLIWRTTKNHGFDPGMGGRWDKP